MRASQTLLSLVYEKLLTFRVGKLLSHKYDYQYHGQIHPESHESPG